MQVDPSVVNPAQDEQLATQVFLLDEASAGQKALLSPPSVAHVVSFAGTHWPGTDGAAVVPAQSVQSAEQRLVPTQKFCPPSAAQVVWFATTHRPGVAGAAVWSAQSAQSMEQRLLPAQKFWLPSAAQVVASAGTH